MIVRILGEGQFEVDESATEELNALDATLEKAVNAGDEAAFRPALAALVGRVRSLGIPLAADTIKPSDLILPNSKLQLQFGILTFSMDASGYKYRDRGVMPDYPVAHTLADLLAGRDRDMELALSLARSSQRPQPTPR